jgi:hypothetical protein
MAVPVAGDGEAEVRVYGSVLADACGSDRCAAVLGAERVHAVESPERERWQESQSELRFVTRIAREHAAEADRRYPVALRAAGTFTGGEDRDVVAELRERVAELDDDALGPPAHLGPAVGVRERQPQGVLFLSDAGYP